MDAFGKGANFDEFQFMTLQKLSGLTQQVENCSSMYSLDVTGRLPFVTKKKKTALQTWNVCGEVSETFTHPSQYPTSVVNLDL